MDNPESNPQNVLIGDAPKTSTAKKWLIGCGGCLVVLIILAIGIVMLGKTAFDSFMQASNKSVQEVFGDSYKATGYTAIGLPAGKKELRNVLLLLDMPRGKVIVAVDTTISPGEVQVLKSGDVDQIQAYIQKIGAQASSSSGSSSKDVDLNNLRFNAIQSVELPNHKHFPLTQAVMKAQRKGAETYSPAVIALLPEAKDRMIVLFATDARSTSSSPDADFKAELKTLSDLVLQIITDSELDDRLL